MGEKLQNNDILKKLGFDSTNQWILYDDSLKHFFGWISENITDENILTDNEILESEDLIHSNKYLTSEKLNEKLEILNKDFPTILDIEEKDIVILETEIQELKEFTEMYANLGNKMQSTNTNLNHDLQELNNTKNDLEIQIQTVYNICLQKSKELQELQNKNKLLYGNLNDCFIKSHSPPLFIHELPLDQYLLKCDSFMQYFTLYIHNNFKFEHSNDYNDTDDNTENKDNPIIELENIKKQFFYYQEKYITAKVENYAMEHLANELDLRKIHTNNICDLKQEIENFKMINNNYDITFETLINDLRLHLEKISQQEVELVLYQNTKGKFETATKRLDDVTYLSKIISNAISNTELIWILMQLDCEKIQSRIDNTEELHRENYVCNKRIDILRQFQILSPNLMSEIYISQLSKILFDNLNIKIYNCSKKCFEELGRFSLSLENLVQSISSDRKYNQILNFLNELYPLENILKSYIYDGPVNIPMFESMYFLKSFYQSKIKEENIEKKIRHIRSEFQENITFRMNTDKLWSNGQLLWIWFLTDPRKLINAIEEVRKTASKVPTLTGIKTLSGIKRK